MTGVKTTGGGVSLGEFDPTNYWEASGEVQRLLAIPDNQITDRNREDYQQNITVVDEARGAIKGTTTGDGMLDRLITSGQIVSKDELEELRAIEGMLTPGEPVLLQLDGRQWYTGLTEADELYFSGVARNSFFGPASRGYQAIPVSSYVEIQFDWVNEKLGLENIEPGDLPPEGGSGIGLPLSFIGIGPPSNQVPIPDSVREMFEAYAKVCRSENEGRFSYERALHIGQGAVEANLGMTLEKVVDITDNQGLMEFLTSPGSD